MLDTIRTFLKTLFTTSNYSTELEKFIVSKGPKDTYDVEYWTKEYDKRSATCFR
jgi:hypothetical protein